MSSHKVNRHRMFLAFAGVWHAGIHGPSEAARIFAMDTFFLRGCGGGNDEINDNAISNSFVSRYMIKYEFASIRWQEQVKLDGCELPQKMSGDTQWYMDVRMGKDGVLTNLFLFSVRNDEKRWNTETRPKVELKGSMFYWKWNGSQTLVSSGFRQMSTATSVQQKDICAIFTSMFIEWPCNFDLFRLLQILVVHVV